METVRFARIIAQCGRPEAHTQWVPLAKDAELSTAVEQERVMTVHIQTIGTKKDYGEIGLSTRGQRALLIFPRSLRPFAGKRVVGIDYDLLRHAPAAAREGKPPARKTRSAKAAKPNIKLVKIPDKKNGAASVKQPPLAAKKTAKPAKKKIAPSKKPVATADLRSVIRKAMKQLSQGKEVAAYQTLESALQDQQ